MSDEKTKGVQKLLAGKLKRADYERTVYRITPDASHSMDDILLPEYWAHIGHQLRPFDIIEVRFPDASRYVELLVVDCGRLWAKVVVKSDVSLIQAKEQAAADKVIAEESAPYFVKFRGGAKFCIVRRSDGEILNKDIPTKDEAEEILKQIMAVMAA